jgi:hypothetical protein
VKADSLRSTCVVGVAGQVGIIGITLAPSVLRH